MSKVMKMVLRFRVVVHLDIWESLITHVAKFTEYIPLLQKQYECKIWAN